jgi:hypothetical protein
MSQFGYEVLYGGYEEPEAEDDEDGDSHDNDEYESDDYPDCFGMYDFGYGMYGSYDAFHGGANGARAAEISEYVTSPYRLFPPTLNTSR